jgi:diguanylate cyclase (GGDEF)-like protein
LPSILHLVRRLLALCCCSLALAAGAAPQPWALRGGSVFLHNTTPAVISAMAVTQDAQGFLWVGTQAGLARWDGFRARTYLADPATPGALTDNYVRALEVDRAGRLWIGTSAGGLVRYDPATDGFVAVGADLGWLGADIGALAPDGGSGLWVGAGTALARLDPASGTLRRDPAAPPQGGTVTALLQDRRGMLWVGTGAGLAQRPANGGAFATVALPAQDGVAPAVTTLYEDSAGRVWVGTRLRGAFVVEPGANRGRAVQESGPAPDLPSDTVRGIVEARPGDIWLGTYGNGVVRVDVASGTTQRERHDATQPTSLIDDTIGTLYRDRGGRVWVASNYALSQHDPSQTAFETLFGGNDRLIRNPSVPAVLALPDGRVWLGTGEAGVEILDPQRGRVAHLRPDPQRPATALPKARVIALAQATDGDVWIGTQGGLYRAASDGSALARVEVPQRRVSAEVWTLAVDGSTLWMGGLDGLWALDVTDPARPRVLRHLDAEVGHRRVTTLADGPGHVLWIGTSAGLYRLDRTSGDVTQIPSDASDPSALPGGLVSSLLTDRRGRLWVATFGRGIQVEQPGAADGRLRFKRLSTRDGLPQNGVDALLLDRSGNVWASTDDGLAHIDSETLAVRSLRVAQGVGILAYWTGSASVTPAGELLFGGQGGLVVVHPERLTARQPGPPPLVVTEATIGDRNLPAARLASREALEIAPHQRSLMVEFAALDYTEPGLHRYAYRLLGFDDTWVETPASRRLATYTNLPPGDYTLQLRAAPAQGAWSEPLSLPLRVAPLWYQHPLVRLATVAFGLAVLAGLVQLRTLVLRQRQRRLEALVAERTAELERRGEELKQSQRQLEQLAYFDALTGLANRRLFGEELRRLIAQAQRGASPFALLLVDLDRFKQVNDALGHDVGDAMLVAAANRLRAAVREGDRVARLGGDEFAVLLTQAGEPGTVDAACRRILDLLGQPLDLPGAPPLQVSASLGLALCPQHAQTPDELYKAADVALYDAKRSGRNTWREWRPDRAAPATTTAG